MRYSWDKIVLWMGVVGVFAAIAVFAGAWMYGVTHETEIWEKYGENYMFWFAGSMLFGAVSAVVSIVSLALVLANKQQDRTGETPCIPESQLGIPASEFQSSQPSKGAKRCRECGYVLERLPEGRCPECSREFAPDDPETYMVVSPRRNIAVLCAIASFAGYLAPSWLFSVYPGVSIVMFAAHALVVFAAASALRWHHGGWRVLLIVSLVHSSLGVVLGLLAVPRLFF